MHHNVFILLCLAVVLRYARAYPDLLRKSVESDLFFDDQLIDPMQSNELVNPTIDSDVDPNMWFDETIDLDQDPSLLANTNEYCSSPTESPESLIDKIRVRGQTCISPISSPPPPKADSPSLKLPEEPGFQSPLLGGFPISPPYTRYPRCYDKLPYCCPSGRMPDNTFQGCKACEETSFFSVI